MKIKLSQNSSKNFATIRMNCGGKKSGCFITLMPQFIVKAA